MNSFLKDFRLEWYRPNNVIPRLILINVAFFVIINLVLFISEISGGHELFVKFARFIFIPKDFADFLYTPWTLITYSFSHFGFFHLLSNMLFLYWFGSLLRDSVGNQRVLAMYFYGAFAGGLLYLLLFNTVNFFISMRTPADLGMLGASASVYAIVVCTATLMPDFRVHLLLIGEAKLKYIAIALVFLSFLAIPDSNAGGNIAHLGGALVGFVFAKQLMRGNDLSRPLTNVFAYLEGILSKKPKMQVVKSTKAKSKSNSQDASTLNPNEEIIDRILDKISESGYESLSDEEKQILFRASQKK